MRHYGHAKVDTTLNVYTQPHFLADRVNAPHRCVRRDSHGVGILANHTFFAGPRPRLRFVGSERIDESVIRLVYVPE
jgi:hypothetical protein